MAEPELDSPVHSVPAAAWTPLVTALLVLLPGLLGIATGRPALFPSLGPTALFQAHTPDHPSSRFYNIVVSHLLGIGCGCLMVAIFGIARQKSVFEVGELSWARVGAATAAVGLAAVLELLFRAPHPPAASTTLLVALGTFHPTWRDIVTIVMSVLVVAVAGEFFRRLRARGIDSPRARDGVRA
jgi:CBS-domain-containing membrane protein